MSTTALEHGVAVSQLTRSVTPDEPVRCGLQLLWSDAASATGLFLIAWTIFTAYMTVAAIRTSVAVLAVFVVLTATFLALTVATYSESVGLAHLGGWLGLATAALAWYASFAGVANATFQKTVLPVGPANAK